MTEKAEGEGDTETLKDALLRKWKWVQANRMRVFNYAVLIGFVASYEFWGAKGLAIFGSLFLIIFLIRLYIHRQLYFDAMARVETAVFGKPLKKELWKKGEWEHTKFRPSFGKKEGRTYVSDRPALPGVQDKSRTRGR